MLTTMMLACVGAEFAHLQRENAQPNVREYPHWGANSPYSQQGAFPQADPQLQSNYYYQEPQQQPYSASPADPSENDAFGVNEADAFAAQERREEDARAAKALQINAAARWQNAPSFTHTQQLGAPFPGILQSSDSPRFDARPFPSTASGAAAVSNPGRTVVAETAATQEWKRYGHCMGANQSPVNLPSVASEWPSTTNNFDRHFIFNKQKPKNAMLMNDGHVYTVALTPSAAHGDNNAQVHTREPEHPQHTEHPQHPQWQVDTEAVANLVLPPGGRDDRETFGLAVIPSHEVHMYHVTAIRMHFPSEHAVHGQLFGGEIHLLMTRADGKELSVGVFVDRRATVQDPRQDSLEAFLPGLRLPPAVGSRAAVKVNLHALHRVLQGPFWRYEGSSTVPPCEPTDWLMFQFALGVRADTLDRLTSALPRANRRPLQASDGRVFTANTLGTEGSSARTLVSSALVGLLSWWL